MKKKYLFIVMILTTLLMSCNNEPDLPTTKKRTVLIYIAGQNSLSDFVNGDINEMKQGLKSVDIRQYNLLIYIDNYDRTQLIHLTKSSNGTVIEKVIKNYDNQNSVGVNEMKSILSEAYTKFPAESYGIVFWSHGDAWLPAAAASRLSATTRWWGQDQITHFMDIQDLNEALTAAPHFDFILFDACFMQSIEVAYELRSHADYFIGSPTEIPGPGAPYQNVVPALCSSKQGADLAKGIAHQYYAPYSEIYDGSVWTSDNDWTGGVAIGVIKSSALDNLAQETKKIITTFVSDPQYINTEQILFYGRGTKYYQYYDFDGVIKELTVHNNSNYDTWKSAFLNASIQFETTPKVYAAYEYTLPLKMFPMTGACGISSYVPKGINLQYDNFYKTLSWYNAVGWREIFAQ